VLRFEVAQRFKRCDFCPCLSLGSSQCGLDADNSRPLRLRFLGMRKSQTSTRSTRIRPLDRAFFSRDPRRVARELLGKVLVRQGDVRHDLRLTARIVEVEAYLGEKDPAAHAAAGRTARTSVLFGPPGHAYVYFIYGNHYCLNVTCEPEGRAGCVLFRALEPLSGMEEMAQARGYVVHGPKDLVKLTSGPGRLCEAFAITRARDNACDLTSKGSSLWIGEDGYRARGIRTTPRIGITKAVDKPLRYLLDGNPFVSGRKVYPLDAGRKSGAPAHGTATRQHRD
jgi:DNA-3-methyladenine glycosylase